MNFLSSVKALYGAVLILVVATVLTLYLEYHFREVHGRQMEIRKGVEEIVRMDLKLNHMMALAVAGHDIQALDHYETIQGDLEKKIRNVMRLARNAAADREVAVAISAKNTMVATEREAIKRMKAGEWGAADAMIRGEFYLKNKEVYFKGTDRALSLILDDFSRKVTQKRMIFDSSLLVYFPAFALLI
ncbi:MAG: hypothetical protein GY846_04565, partial [Deltaproteobacteria bacterium]|nr:hypothetical protein [Deltaproteobacteria bacterium]